MGETILVFAVILGILIVLFLIFREILNWYWKINERIALQEKTNFLLEKISLQLGASNIIDEITIEKISTGKIRKMKMNEWIDLKNSSKNVDDYRIITDDNDSKNS